MKWRRCWRSLGALGVAAGVPGLAGAPAPPVGPSAAPQAPAAAAAPLATGELDAAGTSFGPGIYNAVKRDIALVAVADNGQLNRGLASSAAVVKKGEAATYQS